MDKPKTFPIFFRENLTKKIMNAFAYCSEIIVEWHFVLLKAIALLAPGCEGCGRLLSPVDALHAVRHVIISTRRRKTVEFWKSEKKERKREKRKEKVKKGKKTYGVSTTDPLMALIPAALASSSASGRPRHRCIVSPHTRLIISIAVSLLKIWEKKHFQKPKEFFCGFKRKKVKKFPKNT